MRSALIDCLWVFGLDAACAFDLWIGAAQHPAAIALMLALLNFAVGYGVAMASQITATQDEGGGRG